MKMKSNMELINSQSDQSSKVTAFSSDLSNENGDRLKQERRYT